MTEASRRTARFPAGRGSAKLLCGASISALALLGLPTPALADDRHWDPNNTALGSGGSGMWNTTDPFWSLSNDGVSGPYSPWNNGALDDAFFGGTAGTVTVVASITVQNITFTSNGYTITGGTLNLDGTDPTITVTTGTSVIESVVNSTSGLIKAGGGTLNLNASNTFNGGIDVNGGRLNLNAANTFAGDINVNSGSIGVVGDAALGDIGNVINMQAGTGLAATGALSSNRTVNLIGPGNVGISGGGVGSAFFTGAGGISASGSVAMNNDANDYTGSTAFFGSGAASFTSIGNLGETSSLGAPTTVANGTISFSNSSQTNHTLIYVGDGDTSDRNWVISPGSGPGGPRPQLRNGGSGTLTLTGNIALGGGSGNGPQFYAQSADLELLGVISSNNGRPASFIADPGRTLTLGDASTFTGIAAISGAGTVVAGTIADSGVASSLGAGSQTNISGNGTLSYTGAGVSSNRNWNLNNGTLSNDGSGALTLSGAMAIGNTATLGGSFTGADNVYSGVISGGGNLRSGGDATWILSGANTYSGQTIVDSGVLRAGTAGAFGGSTQFVVNGGTLDLNGFDRMLTTLNGTGGTLDLGSATLTLQADEGVSATYAGSITGSGGLTKLGGSTQTLTGANTYTGDTTIGGGTLNLDFSGAGGPTSDIIGSGSTLSMGGGVLNVIGAAGENSTQTFDGLNITAGNNTIDASSGTGGSITVNLGAITRTGGLMNFELPDSGNITTTNLTLGGWATVNGTDYAKVEMGNILAFEESDYTEQDDASQWMSGQFITEVPDVTGFFGTVGSSIQLGGLRYTEPVSTTVTVAAGQTLGVDGAIIVAPTVEDFDQLITGGMITGAIGGDLGVRQNSEGNFTIDSQIVDNGGPIGFVKAGTGLVTLGNANNSYTGGTLVAQGTLSVGNIGNGGAASGLGASSADSSNLVMEGGTLRYTGGTTSSDRGFTFLKSGDILGAGVEVTDANASLTFSGLITSPDDASFTKSGPGTLTLANPNNDYMGITTVTGGLLSVNTLPNGGVVSPIGQSSSDPANLVLDGGGLQYTGATTITDRGFTLGANDGTVDVTDAGTELTVSGTIVGPGNALTKEGDGTLILSGTNTYTGGNTINGGVLRAGSTQAFGGFTGQPTTLADVAGVTLDLNDFDNSIGPLNGGGANGGNVTLGSATLRIVGGNGNYSGVISGTGGVWRTNGGTQTFNGCNHTYTGSTLLQGANLSTDCLLDGGLASGIGASSADSTSLVFNNGSLLYTGGSVSIDRGFQLLGAGGIHVTDAGTTLEFEGAVIGGGALIKREAGTLVLSGTNTYTGNTQVEGGVLRAAATNAFGPQGHMSLNNTAGVLLDLDSFDTVVTSLIGGGANGGNIDLGSATLTLNTVDNRTYAGAITGTGNLVKNGNTLQALSGCGSDYTGTTTINAGTLQVTCLEDGGVNSSIGASSSDPANLVINGTLNYVGSGGSTNREFTLGTSGGTIGSNGSGPIEFSFADPVTLAGTDTARTLTLTGNNTGTNIFSPQLDDNGTGATSLTKTGDGLWRLTSANSTYTGVTTINGGILEVNEFADGGMASSIGAASSAAANLVIGNGSTLRYTGAGDTSDRLFTLATGVAFIESSGTGALQFTNTGAVGLTGTNAPRTMALGGTNTGDNIFGGAIGDNGTGATTLAKNDSGTWILTGNNSYSGNTVINNGNLMIGNGGSTGNAGVGNVIVDSPTSTLSLNRSDTFVFSGTLSGPGTLAQIGTGTSALTATNNSIGATTVSAGTLQVDGGLVTPTIAMTGTSALTVNGTAQAAGPSQIAITGDAGNQTITVGSGGILLANGNLGGGADTVDLAGTLATGGAVLSLGPGNDTLVLRDGALITGAGIDAGAGTDALVVDNALALGLDAARASGFESLTKQNDGVLTLTGNHSYSDGTAIDAGTLRIGNGGASGTLAGDIANDATLEFNRSGTLTIAGRISGTGAVDQLGPGTVVLTGANGYAGATNVSAGTLLVNGDQSAATGLTSVASGATLGGDGTIGGDVALTDGATLAPGSNGVGVLTINGSLSLADASRLAFQFGQANVPGGPLNDLVDVGGDLVLDGTIDVAVSPGGSFGIGLYRVISYGGALTDNGLAVGAVPPGADVLVQTAVAGQVNLVNSGGLTLNFWDGAVGPKFSDTVDGGSGTWQNSTGNDNWTEASGALNAPYSDGAFAIFSAAPGTVTVDNSLGAVSAAGMQFASGGYLITGDEVTLTAAQSVIRVGDGTAAGAAFTATIDAGLTGAAQLVKTDQGTLVLSGVNSYAGGTLIDEGTLRIASDASLGAATGGLGIGNATLNTTADIVSDRAADLSGNATFLTDAGTALTLTGIVSGAGALAKDGAGTLVLAAANGYAGGTVINAGTLQLGNGGTSGSIAGDVLNDGTLAFDRSDSLTFGGVISGSGAVSQIGTGTTILTADNSYAGGTTIAAGTLRLGAGGTSGGIAGDVLNAGTLAFDRSDSVTFAGLVSGSGSVEQAGNGITILTAGNSYAGATIVNAGTLLINGDQSAATGPTTVNAGGTIGGLGTIGGSVAIADGGTINPGDIGSTPGVLTIAGSLELAAAAMLDYGFGQANVVGGPFNDLIEVGGDLVLDGTINVATSGGGRLDPGIYRVINYAGTLTDNGLSIGAIPSGNQFFVQTSVAGQVNLINTNGLALRFWDGAQGARNDGIITGGDGVWQNVSGNDNWTLEDASINAPFLDSAFAIFGGAAGTVTVDQSLGAINVSGMQFATDGYVIEGDAINLVGAPTVIRVGDGTAAGAEFTATIASDLQGTSQLVKSDLGTLELSGTNSYTGGTAINEGTLRISADVNLGDAAGGLSFNGGTLNTTADIASDRPVVLVGAGTLLPDGGTALALAGAIAGMGSLVKEGEGTLVLTGTNSYAGNTIVAAGRLFVNGNQSAATGLVSLASGTTLGGTGTIGGDVAVADGATLAPGMNGTGTLAINGSLSLSPGSQLDYEFGEANLVGGAFNDLVTVGGDLVLDGTINVSVPIGGVFAVGIYRVFNYGGALTDNGLALGTLPAGSDVTVQTAIAGQVNLVNSGGLLLNFWDGPDGPRHNGAIEGGDGIWQNSLGNDNWTNATGAVNAAYSSGAFAIFGGTGGTVTVDRSLGDVAAAGMQFAVDGYVIVGDGITLVGPQSPIRVGDGSAAGADHVARIESVLSGNTQLVKTDAGTLVLGGANSYTGGTAIIGGTISIADDANLGAATGGITLDGGTLHTTADVTSARAVSMAGPGTLRTDAGTTFTSSGALSGAGSLTKSGEGLLVLTADSAAYGGSARVAAGTLAVNGRIGGSMAVAAGARLEGLGRVGGTTNGGTIAPGFGGEMGTLTIQGDYVSEDGLLEIAAVLGDDNSATSRLVVNGSAFGTTQVSVFNRGGLGGQTEEGVKIIDVAGASNGSFVLNGDYLFEGDPAIIAGAYGYRLFQGGISDPTDGDWYLRSALLNPRNEPEGPLYQPGVPLYESYAQTLQTLNGLPTLQERVGNRQWSGFTQSGVGMWGRIEAARLRPEAAVSTSGTDVDTNSWDFQVGFDATVMESDAGLLVAGINGRYGTADARVRSRFGGGEIDTKRFGIGATLTWYGNGGFYADAQAQASWYDADLDSDLLGSLANGNDGSGESFSLEVGRRLPIGGGLSITPQAQIVYSNVRFDAFVDPSNAAVSSEDGDSLRGRLGLSLDHQRSRQQRSGGAARTHVYGLVNLEYEGLDGSRADVSGTPLLRRDDRLWGELGIGGSYSWNDGRFTIYSELSVNTALSNFGDSNMLHANAGLRMRF